MASGFVVRGEGASGIALRCSSSRLRLRWFFDDQAEIAELLLRFLVQLATKKVPAVGMDVRSRGILGHGLFPSEIERRGTEREANHEGGAGGDPCAGARPIIEGRQTLPTKQAPSRIGRGARE